MNSFGEFIRTRRESLNEEAMARREGPQYTLRAVARRLDIEPSHLSKVEMGKTPPSDQLIQNLAAILGADVDVMMALAGKVSPDLHAIIVKRPLLFASLLRELRDAPDDAILRVVREVRDGQW